MGGYQSKEYSRAWYRANKDKVRAANLKWYKKNKDKCRAYTKKWRRKNRKKFNAMQVKCYYKHRSKRLAYAKKRGQHLRKYHSAELNAYQRSYYKRNKKKFLAYQTKWREKNRGHWDALRAKGYAMREAIGSVPSWFSKEHFMAMVAIYDKAVRMKKKGKECSVRHTYKLLRCKEKYQGLHLPWNLKVIRRDI